MVTSRKKASSASNIVVTYQSSNERVVTVTAAQSDDVAVNAVSDNTADVDGIDVAHGDARNPTCPKL